MNSLDICLKPDDLHDYLLGLVSEERAGPIERHLQTCRACLAVVGAHAASDSFTRALRSGATRSVPAEAQVVCCLVEQLHREGPPDTVPPALTDSVASGRAASADELPFLMPPVLPDEIGRLGGYRVLRRLGAGGMGIVLLGEDTKLNRKVALKVLRPALAVDAEQRQRFQREAQAAAQLSHDHIVTVYQVGEDHETPFFAMQMLEGESLEDRLQALAQNGQTMPIEEVVRIGREIAAGLTAAHEQGLIHRDIKPANVWLEGSRGRVKLLDFGLARPLEDAGKLTRSGMLLGTPQFMAPEQVEGGGVDHRCDLFSLGCVLFQLATGRLPFVAATTFAVLRAVTDSEPGRADQGNPQVPAELAGLIAALLAKEPANRPTSARVVMAELEQLERELQGRHEQDQTQAVALQRPRPGTQRWRGWLAVAGLVLAVGVAAGIVLRLNSGEEPLVVVSEDPDVASGKPLHPDAFVAQPASIPGVASWTIVPRGPDGGAYAFSPNGRLLASADTHALRIWDTETRKLLHVFLSPIVTRAGQGGLVRTLAWSPNGQRLAVTHTNDRLEIWDVTLGRLACPPRRIWCSRICGTGLAWAPDGKKVAVGSDGFVEIVDAFSGELIDKLKHQGAVSCAAWSPDGHQLASVSEEDGRIKIWDPAEGKELQKLTLEQRFNWRGALVAWSPDGRYFCGCAPENTVIWKSQDWKVQARLEQGASGPFTWLADSKTLAIKRGMWDATTGKLIRAIHSERQERILPPEELFPRSELAWSPDGKKALAGAGDDLYLWDTAAGKRTLLTPTSGAYHWEQSFSPDGKWAAVRELRLVRVLEARTGKQVWQYSAGDGSINSIAWSPRSDCLACCTLNAPLTEAVAVPPNAPLLYQGMDWYEAAFSPDGNQLIASHNDFRRAGHFIHLRERNGTTPRSLEGIVGQRFVSVSWSPDGQTLAAAGEREKDIHFWDRSGKKLPFMWVGESLSPMAWSPDGKLLAARKHLFDRVAGKVVRTFELAQDPREIRWSADGLTLSFRVGEEIHSFEAQTGKASGKRPLKPRSTVAGLLAGKFLVVGPEGHFRSTPSKADREVVYVALIKGRQETFTAEEFRQKFGWQNQPDKVRLADGW